MGEAENKGVLQAILSFNFFFDQSGKFFERFPLTPPC